MYARRVGRHPVFDLSDEGTDLTEVLAGAAECHGAVAARTVEAVDRAYGPLAAFGKNTWRPSTRKEAISVWPCVER
ncbi:MAG: hypothetical protein OXC11_07900, partial [Rhodospirillales bacterium]|nr:hypothetical protein [Rhodospirillales bacterium]